MARVRPGRRGGFFAQVPHELQDDPDADGLTVATYAALHRSLDFNRPTGATISHKTLAARAGCSPRALQKRLVQLRDAGWIGWETGGQNGRPNIYVVHSRPEGGTHEVPTPPSSRCRPGTHEVPTHLKGSDTEKVGDAGASPARTNWLAPYAEAHEQVLGGKIDGGKAARYLRPLDEEHGPAIAVPALKRYLEHLVATGRVEFLSLPKFAETFGQWRDGARTPRSRRRPTQVTDKDYRL